MGSLPSGQADRKKVSIEAAKLLAEGFVRDYHAAKIKAAKNLGFSDSFDLPTNREIEDELKLNQAMFDANGHDATIYSLRKQALEAMNMFEKYTPRLAGPVFDGTATQYSPIEIQVFSDSPKDMVINLLDLNVPFDTEDRKVRLSKNDTKLVPVFCFGMGDFEVEVTVLPPNSLRQSPLSPVSGAPMERASIKNLIKMLES